MKTYNVYVPIAGYAFVQVEADSIEEAKEIGFEEAYNRLGDSDLHDDICELEPYERVMEGNVCHLSHPYIEVEEDDEE